LNHPGEDRRSPAAVAAVAGPNEDDLLVGAVDHLGGETGNLAALDDGRGRPQFDGDDRFGRVVRRGRGDSGQGKKNRRDHNWVVSPCREDEERRRVYRPGSNLSPSLRRIPFRREASLISGERNSTELSPRATWNPRRRLGPNRLNRPSPVKIPPSDGRGRSASYTRSAGFVQGTASPASTTKMVEETPSGKSLQRFSPCLPSNAVPLPVKTW